MLLVAAASLFMVHGAPLDMPRATAFLGRRGDEYRLIDRYATEDLWTSRAVLGRWYDDDLRVFTLARLDYLLPDSPDEVKTREDYGEALARLEYKDEAALLAAIKFLAPAELAEDYVKPRQAIRGFRDVRYFAPTNESAIVCAFLPEKPRVWHVISWELAEGDEFAAKRAELEENWFREFKELELKVDKLDNLDERELLKADARHSVALYGNWHYTDGGDFAVLDDLADSRRFVTALTNDLAHARRRFREVMPGVVDLTNTLATVRIFADRDEYLEVAGSDKAWTAAYWSQERRELVAYMGEEGDERLLDTMRHEAFHQYLAYSTSMMMASPWLNEGYAGYFEDEKNGRFFAGASLEELERYASYLPTIIAMDYEQFYSGDVELNYLLARSIAYFLENGAPQVRFKPFKNLKRDYLKALVESQDMKTATVAAFRNTDTLKLFVAEWLKFYKNT